MRVNTSIKYKINKICWNTHVSSSIQKEIAALEIFEKRHPEPRALCAQFSLYSRHFISRALKLPIVTFGKGAWRVCVFSVPVGKNLIRSFHAAVVSRNRNTLRSLLKLSFHSGVTTVSPGKKKKKKKHLRTCTIQYAHIDSFTSLLQRARAGPIFRSIIYWWQIFLTQTSVSSRNRTRDSPGLSNTGRCYLSSPSAIYFWRLMEFRRGARVREGGREGTGCTHGRTEKGRQCARE